MRAAGAIDIGGTRTKLGVIADDGRIVSRATVSTSARGEPTRLVNDIVAGLRPLLEAAAAQGTPAEGIGVSVAGFLDPGHTEMVENANLPELCGFPLRRTLEQRLGLDCRLEVDSNASTLAEYRFGAGRGARRLLGVSIGTGLGGGVIIDELLLRHTGECAGDVGHVIVSPDGRRCTCGSHGCLEAMVCSAALSERAGGRPVRDIVDAAARGDERCVNALAETGRWLGIGLASLAPLFAPERIVVGGGVGSAGDFLLEPARRSFRRSAGDAFRDSVEIVGSTLGGWEGLVGAASVLLSHEPAEG